MAITSTGVGPNLDIESIISQLMTVEQKPLTALAKKEASYQAKLTAFGSLKGALAQFQSSMQGVANASNFKSAKASVADSAVASASGTSEAAPGTYTLEVTKLAQAQKLAAAGQASDAVAIGSGVITFDFGTISGGSFDEETGVYTGAGFASSGSGIKTVTIDPSSNSLAGIRDAINKANIGVTATIVNDGGSSPYRLTLSVQNTGKDNSLKISVADAEGDTGLSSLLSYDPAGTQNLVETAKAQNAEFTVDGIKISKSTNTVTDVLSGVTLNLLKTNKDASTSITVSRDASAVTNAINSFISSYNSVIQTLQQARAYDAKTRTGAILNGESSVRTIETQLRNVLTKSLPGGASVFKTLSEVGVSVQKDGKLVGDNTKLQKAIASNFDDFAGLFAAAGRATDSLSTFTGSSSKTQPGSYAVYVSQLATQGKAAASGAAGLNITAGVNDTLEVQVDGVSATITLAAGNYASAAALATEIQSKINGAAELVSAGSTVRVAESGGVLTITSDRYGSTSNAAITGGNGQDNLNLGAGATITAGLDVAGFINGVAATGSGQSLTGATGDASEGIKLQIAGGVTGGRGLVTFSQGYAYQFDQILTSMLGEDGIISARTEGLNDTIERLGKDQERLSDRLDEVEKRYRAQFTALDVLLSKMNTTSSYLTQQLSALENLNKQSSS